LEDSAVEPSLCFGQSICLAANDRIGEQILSPLLPKASISAAASQPKARFHIIEREQGQLL